MPNCSDTLTGWLCKCYKKINDNNKKVQQVIVNAISYLKCPYGNECMTMIYRNVWMFQFRAAWSPTCRGCGGRWRRCSPSPAPSPAASPAAESTRSRLRAGVSENREKIWTFVLQFTVILFISFLYIRIFLFLCAMFPLHECFCFFFLCVKAERLLKILSCLHNDNKRP